MIRNLTTGKVSPQFHVVYDDWFSTVSNFNHPDQDPDLGIDLDELLRLDFSREYYLDEELDGN